MFLPCVSLFFSSLSQADGRTELWTVSPGRISMISSSGGLDLIHNAINNRSLIHSSLGSWFLENQIWRAKDEETWRLCWNLPWLSFSMLDSIQENVANGQVNRESIPENYVDLLSLCHILSLAWKNVRTRYQSSESSWIQATAAPEKSCGLWAATESMWRFDGCEWEYFWSLKLQS